MKKGPGDASRPEEHRGEMRRRATERRRRRDRKRDRKRKTNILH